MIMTLSLSLILPFLFLCWIIGRYTAAKLRSKHSLPLPPGPDQLPILGAALQVNTNNPWLTYGQWEAKYGEIVSCRFFGNQVVILNSERVADDLLERRSRIYSDRAEVSTVNMSGWDFDFVFDRYGNDWRLHRRLFQQSFREQKVPDYQPTQRAAAHRLLINMSNSPAEKLWGLLSLCTSSAILSIVYGYEVNTLDDPLFTISDKAIETGIPLLTPEKSMIINTFPFVKYLPTWFPGTSIVRDLMVAKHWSRLYVDFPYDFTMKKMLRLRRVSAIKPGIFLRAFGDDMKQRGKRSEHTGIPHVSVEDDVYEGYFIPKGWSMSRDPRRYPEPEAFKPERFLTKDGELNDDDVGFTFGWGRRICPGRYSASAAIWMAVASMLAAYTFERAKDDNGVEIDPIPEWNVGVTRNPKQPPLRVVPKFSQSKLEQMVQECWRFWREKPSTRCKRVASLAETNGPTFPTDPPLPTAQQDPTFDIRLRPKTHSTALR
ncbi:cytochrome P450 [Coniophora puteana RWD-64-598 SS2]|uniref:Cytochrome P450 n=1 Tax=Coniophora puteana (strain RWD-64-598) TaxID=741705 RepID=A0A5M3MZ09_CONPW|nr:cytochrome P450 [Coniophora puteana RWD-64-598 SS2]EIW84359.1 cytochrome P450 [Coniophora puteana RWD-64-598 SS2]